MESDAKKTPSPTGTIFIVDDEEMVTTSIKTMLLLETGHRVHTFNHPKAALERLSELRPHVVISDFLMPEMDGISFLRQVKEALPESTLILLTGYADKESAIQAINTVGIYRYIEKPWDNEEIKLSIKNGLERAGLMSDLRESVRELTEAQEQLQSHNQRLESLVEARTQDLQLTYQKMRAIVQNTADGIITLNAALEVSTLNPAAEKWLVRQFEANHPNAFLNRKIHEILTVPGERSIKSFFNQEQSRLLKEALIGDTPVEVSISPFPETGGYVLVLRDIAQRKEIERLREDFVSTLTHDLRTPLLAAIQTLGFLGDGSLGPLSERQAEILQMLTQSNRDMLGLVNVLLEVYKYESGRQRLVWDSVDVAQMLSGVVRELDSLARNKGQTLALDLPPEVPTVKADKQELRRVFVNLIGNAINFTPAEGKIQVSAALNGSFIRVSVTDNGRGIPARDIPQLFQRFSQGTSKQRSSGSGLGLYLSRQIIEAHQGSIWVESEEGRGSCFSLTLPLAPSGAPVRN